nr:retrovirus-related Pol polyprotein from transposon TNT 1-94 [Tanacetum cinerariifolium]
MIKRVYYVEGLNHNLFSVGQFCDADLEVAFWKSTCYIRDLNGNDLLTGSRGTDLYSISLQDTTSPNPICLMAKATSSQAWLWHRRLSYLNFDTINLLSNNDIVIGLSKLKFVKDHLCSSCKLGKAKGKSFQTKATPSSKGRLQLLHMDLCGPMRVASINGKKYVLVIVDDYSRYTWTHLLRIIRTDKGTEFLNQILHAYFASEGILHQTFVARTPKQNSVVERQNRTLVEATRTMLSAAKVPLYFWAEAISTRTRVIMESVHVNFDELPQMALDHVSFDPVPECQRTKLKHDSLNPGPQCQENVTQADGIVTTSNELDLLFSLILNPGPQCQENVTQADGIVTMSNELDLLFSLMFDELPNGSTQVMSKSFAVTTTDTPNQRQQQNTTPLNTQTTPDPTCQVPTQAPTVTSTENINQAETIEEYAPVENDEFINIFSTPVQDREETSSRHVNSSNMHTFYPHYPSEHRWTKDHPLEQEEVYVNQPDGFVDPYHPDKVYRLKKALYGLKQAPRVWYDELSTFLVSKGFPKGGDKLVSWSSKKQDCTSMSSAEADSMDENSAYRYGFHFDTIPMYCDSKAAIAISCNPVQHSHTRHIDVTYHFIKENVEKGIIELFFVKTEYQLADLFTKALPEERFKYLVRRL